MKLVEAMNELKLTEKKLRQDNEFIKKYAARPSFEDDPFQPKKPDEGAPKKVRERLQAAMDRISRHEKLKRDIDYTNLVTMVDVATNGKAQRMSIHSLILHKRLLVKLKRNVYNSLDESRAMLEVQQMRYKEKGERNINAQVVYNFDIQSKEEKLTDLHELETNIDSALQIANAKVELQECPEDGKKK